MCKPKICSTCKLIKPIENFHKYKNSTDGHTHRCKECVSRKKITHTNFKKCTICCIEKQLSDYHKRKNGKLGYDSTCKNCRNKKINTWRTTNKEHFSEYIKNYNKNKTESDPLFKLIKNVRCRVSEFLKGRKLQKNNRTFNIVGCTPIKLKTYLEEQFVDGMSWNNYGIYGWHIDHIIPLSSAKTEEEIFKLCHYTNLQPLWAVDNLKKSNKLIINEY